MAQQQNQNRASIFGGIADQKTFDRLPRLAQGDYVLKVKKLGGFVGRVNNPVVLFEFEIIEAKPANGVNPMDVGQQVAFAWDLSKDTYGYSKGEIKKALAAICKIDHKTMTQSDVDQCVDPEHQPLKDSLVRCRVAPGEKINPATGIGYIESRFSPHNP